MSLTLADVKTLEIINKEFFFFKDIEKLKSANEALRKLLADEIVCANENELLLYINNYIRTPLYRYYKSEDDNFVSDKIFTILMVLTTYWPLNTNCCLTLSHQSVPHEKRAIFLTGHVANKDELLNAWVNTSECLHPALGTPTSMDEILYNIPYAKKVTPRFPQSHPARKEFEKWRESKSTAVFISAFALSFISIAALSAAFVIFSGGAVLTTPLSIVSAYCIGMPTLLFLPLLIANYFRTFVSNQQGSQYEWFINETNQLVDEQYKNAVKAKNSISKRMIEYINCLRDEINRLPTPKLNQVAIINNLESKLPNKITRSHSVDWLSTGLLAKSKEVDSKKSLSTKPLEEVSDLSPVTIDHLINKKGP
jgi:hypothetical protein